MSALPEKPFTYRGKFVVRTLGTIFVATCCGMLILGQTVLRDKLAGPQFLLYWSWCFLITLLAGVTALLDMLFIRRASRQFRRDLLERELKVRE